MLRSFPLLELEIFSESRLTVEMSKWILLCELA